MSTDINTLSLYDRHNEVFTFRSIRAKPGDADALKISKCTNITVYVEEVIGGLEDVLDVNNECSNIKVIIGRAVVMGRFLLTIKGGSQNVQVHILNLVNRGTEMDIDLGNHSDQSSRRTQCVVIDITATEVPNPVRWRCINAEKPILLGPVNYKRTLVLPRWLGRIADWVIGKLWPK